MSVQSRNVCIIDYGMGNLSSVASALASLGCAAVSSADTVRIAQADGLILPGVGAFGEAMSRIHALGLIKVLERRVLGDKIPFLGICLGMQLLGRDSTEGGLHQGLGWIDASVDRIPADVSIRVPHIGWNEVAWTVESPLNGNLEQNGHFYFNHSYCMQAPNEVITAVTDVGKPLVAAVRRGNIWGVQFHPEKSQNNGRRLLRNFLNAIPILSPEAQTAC
ncbi:MAG: imidazole glycerol phosphate synthase subunit HisH [Rhodospirillaceae bacterium]|nr:MAG: imidazole glycerol phosphate synthase subunit HisH [Rhodospirillaceae bacterium]